MASNPAESTVAQHSGLVAVLISRGGFFIEFVAQALHKMN
jgi:hypothetical protein